MSQRRPATVPHPALIAWALLPAGWGALDLLAHAAAQTTWTPWLNQVGWWVCRFLDLYEDAR